MVGQGLGPSGLLGLYEYGRNVMYSLFDQLNSALSGCPALKLQNSLDSPGIGGGTGQASQAQA